MTEIISHINESYTIFNRKSFGPSKKIESVDVIFHDGKKRKMLLKRPNCSYLKADLGKTQSEIYTQKILRLAEAEIPVLSEVHIISDKEVLIPNLLEDGGVILDKHAKNFTPYNVTYDVAQLIKNFEVGNAIYQLAKIVSQADSYRIGLPVDDMFALLIKPDFELFSLVLDVDMTDFSGSAKNASNNKVFAALFYRFLQNLQKNFNDQD